MDKDLISIVVPAYNHGRYIDGCIDSIIAQTYDNIELIIVNDGSTDNTADKIKSRSPDCEKRFKNFVFVDKANEGIVKTFNHGVHLASGEFVAVCASDDAYTPDAIERLHDFLSSHPDYVLAVGDNYIMDDDSKVCYWDSDQDIVYEKQAAHYETFGQYLGELRKSIDFSSDDFGSYRSFLFGNYIPNGYLLKREVFIDKIGGYSENAPLEDLYLHLQMSKYGKYKYIDTPLFYYRWHSTNTVKQLSKMAELETRTFEFERQCAEKAGLLEVYKKYRDKLGSKNKVIIPYLLLIKKHYAPEKQTIQVKMLGLNLFEKRTKGNIDTIKILYIPVYKKRHRDSID